MKNIFVLSIIYCLLLNTAGASLPHYSENSYQRRTSVIFIETHVLPNDTLLDCYVTYKIPNKNLVFVKNDSVYKGGISFFLEVLKDGQVVGRESSNREIELTEYQSTISGSKYLEGMLKLSLEKNNYTFIPSISILNTEGNFFLERNTLILEREFDKDFIKPIIIRDQSFAIDDISYYPLANFQNFIPFSADNFNIVLPLLNMELDTLSVSVKQGDKTYDYILLRKYEDKSLSFEYSDNHIYLEIGTEQQKINLFVLEKINQILDEGIAEITLSANGEEIKTFTYNVVWIDKPKSLRNSEYAVKLLSNVTNEKVVDNLLDYSDEEQYKELTKFWKNRDPNKETSFNELMNEFYKRADFVNENYSTIDYSGTSLDRGKIYLRFGPPSNIERIFYEKGNVVEIWYYEKFKKEFYFNDKSGLGNFSLMK